MTISRHNGALRAILQALLAHLHHSLSGIKKNRRNAPHTIKKNATEAGPADKV